jgi:hypothetical protein
VTNRTHFEPTSQQTEYAEQLSRRGYRRVSNKYGIVARVDRADWLQFMAQKMGRSVADFFKVDEPDTLSSGWSDHYRRVYSQDKIELEPAELGRLIAASDHDPIGFIDDDGVEKRQGTLNLIGEVQEILREVSTLDCFYTGASCPASCQCLAARAERAYALIYPREPRPIQIESEQCRYCKRGKLPSGKTCGLCDGKGNVVKEVSAINSILRCPSAGMRGKRK